MSNVKYCKTNNISNFHLPTINGRTIFTAGVVGYKCTTSGSGRRSHRPIVNKRPFYQFLTIPIHKTKYFTTPNKQISDRINAYTSTEMRFSGSLVHAGSTAALLQPGAVTAGWFQAYTVITLQNVVSTL